MIGRWYARLMLVFSLVIFIVAVANTKMSLTTLWLSGIATLFWLAIVLSDERGDR